MFENPAMGAIASRPGIVTLPMRSGSADPWAGPVVMSGTGFATLVTLSLGHGFLATHDFSVAARYRAVMTPRT
jgi:hypothetical protein